LTTEASVCADFACHTADFGGERVELIHHRVDSVLEVENFTLHVHRNLAGQIAFGHGSGHVGDIADLTGQVGRHQVHVVR